MAFKKQTMNASIVGLLSNLISQSRKKAKGIKHILDCAKQYYP